MAQPAMLPLDRPDRLPHGRKPHAQEIEIALQVRLLGRGASRIPMAAQLDIDRRGDGRGAMPIGLVELGEDLPAEDVNPLELVTTDVVQIDAVEPQVDELLDFAAMGVRIR